MSNPSAPQTDRRQFLRMLAASPALPLRHAFPEDPPRARPGAVPGGRPRRRADRVGGRGADGLRLRGRRQGEAALRARGVPRRHRGRGDVPREPGGVHASTSSASGAWSTSAASTCRCRSSGRARTPRSSSAPAAHSAPSIGTARWRWPARCTRAATSWRSRTRRASRSRDVAAAPRRARLVPALPRPRMEPDAGHDQAGRGGRLARAGLDHRQPGRRQAHRARARPAPRTARSAAPATR